MRDRSIKQFLGISFFIFFAFACTTDPDTNPDFLAARDIQDEPYGKDPRQKMDVYLPAGRNPIDTPLLIFIHGGAWIDGDKSEFLQIKPTLEREFPGYAFVSLNYRLYDFASNTNGILEQEKDINAAIDYVKNQLAKWNISEDYIISGGSAGGHLALLHAYKSTSTKLKAAVAFFPPTELSELYTFNNFTAVGLTALLGGTPTSASLNYRSASPISHIDAGDVPTIFFHGELDNVVPISQSELLEQQLKIKNIDHKFIRVSGQGHGFTPEIYASLLREAKDFVSQF